MQRQALRAFSAPVDGTVRFVYVARAFFTVDWSITEPQRSRVGEGTDIGVSRSSLGLVNTCTAQCHDCKASTFELENLAVSLVFVVHAIPAGKT